MIIIRYGSVVSCCLLSLYVSQNEGESSHNTTILVLGHFRLRRYTSTATTIVDPLYIVHTLRTRQRLIDPFAYVPVLWNVTEIDTVGHPTYCRIMYLYRQFLMEHSVVSCDVMYVSVPLVCCGHKTVWYI